MRIPSLTLFLFLLFLAGCSSSHCRTQKEVIPPTGPVKAENKAKTLEKGKPTTAVKTATVRVYKYDGTKQCSTGKEVTLKVMAEELKELNVLSQEKLSDGLMRIQVCGQPTGMANVYEIPETNKKKAEGLGFKVWDFN